MAENENDNNAIDQVCILLATLAGELNCATDLIHHSRKGQASPGDADRSRGASAAVDAARLVRTITRMSDDDADIFGVDKKERESLERFLGWCGGTKVARRRPPGRSGMLVEGTMPHPYSADLRARVLSAHEHGEAMRRHWRGGFGWRSIQ